MKKEMVICILIIILIVVTNIVTQRYTKECTAGISERLDVLKEKVLWRSYIGRNKQYREQVE